MQLITVEDRTSPDVLSAKELFNLVWSLNYQLRFHYGRSPWVNAERAPEAEVALLPHDASGVVKPPPGAWNLILLDTSDQAGALGYHEDVEGTTVPVSEVFVQTAREDGVSATEVASHEALEMLVDPDVNKVRTARYDGKLYIMEVCDPVQGCSYDIGAPEGRKTGTLVSDFYLPAGFGLPQPHDPHSMSFCRSVQMPFQLAPKGYISVAPEDEPENWSLIFGQDHPTKELPKWASRLPVIHGLRH
jgi:hypothetical protein